MYGTLFEGDHVVINKLAYGPRLPFTPLSFPAGGQKKYLDWISLPYLRLPGYSHIQRNDVIAFNYELTEERPVDMQEEFIKRCVGLPGDTIRIISGAVYAGSLRVPDVGVYNTYDVISDKTMDTAALKRAGIIIEKIVFEEGRYSLLMSTVKADSLSKTKNIRSVTQKRFAKEYYTPSAYPHFSEFPWNHDHFGPLWLPRRGDSILLSRSTLILYQRCIEKYEKQVLTFKNDTAYIAGKRCRYYHFKQNYYFVLGDNRHNSIDSRITGLLPEDHIIGKASLVLYSSSTASRKFLIIL